MNVTSKKMGHIITIKMEKARLEEYQIIHEPETIVSFHFHEISIFLLLVLRERLAMKWNS
jgi:hypothetical protein